jgi:hypothetical protein
VPARPCMLPNWTVEGCIYLPIPSRGALPLGNMQPSPAPAETPQSTSVPERQVLESAARAITYFLDVHVDSTARKVVDVPGAVAAFCKTLVLFPISDSTDPETARLSRDVAEQVQRE